jgi:hypothetical protein
VHALRQNRIQIQPPLLSNTIALQEESMKESSNSVDVFKPKNRTITFVITVATTDNNNKKRTYTVEFHNKLCVGVLVLLPFVANVLVAEIAQMRR